MMSGDWRVDTAKEALDREMIYAFLSQQAYWSPGIARATVERAIDGSLCFGGYLDGRQVAFARVITDGATFAHLADVFVLPEQRGRGLAQRLIAEILAHPQLQGLRRFMLTTADAHGLYAKFGFAAPARPEWLMERLDGNLYIRTSESTGASP